MRKTLKIGGIALGVLLAGSVSFAYFNNIHPIALHLHNPVYQQNGQALAGYDVVSYFGGAPMAGSEIFTLQWKDITWQFASQENLELFQTNPEQYEPQFGGYCTKAVSTGFAVPGDPTAYTIWQNKLYIFSDANMKSEFLANPQGMVQACILNWN